MTQFVATTFHMSLVAVAQPPQQIPIDLEADRTLSHSHSSHRSSPSPLSLSLHLPHTDLHALCAASFPVGIFCFVSQPQRQPESLSRRLLRLRRGIAIMCHQLWQRQQQQLLHMPQHKRNNTKLCETSRNSANLCKPLFTVLGWCLPHATLVCHRFALVAGNLGFYISIYIAQRAGGLISSVLSSFSSSGRARIALRLQPRGKRQSLCVAQLINAHTDTLAHTQRYTHSLTQD